MNLLEGISENEDDQTPVIILKSVSILLMLGITLFFGCLPFFW
jgi:hypothetical protein